ncbi:Ribosomal protein S16, mitochondrial [Diplodia seriata]|uniref:Ribosomal protein S16, mitochondrial n=1 Tax=Diplodia seriata TaxID=420778 RepID=A0A1S8B8X1_9PEZI|nr:Ribosomal protein S16, mitochondrial [Diplodia seriata]
MVLKIRLARFGKRHAPFYNIVVAHARTARDSKPLEVLGTYDPIPKPARPDDPSGRPYKDIKLDRSRAQYWLGVGAQPSDTCWRLMSMVRPNSPALPDMDLWLWPSIGGVLREGVLRGKEKEFWS